MSAALRKDVSLYLVSERMCDVKLFQSMTPKQWPMLFPILNPLRFEKDELVCSQHEECNEMVIVINGSLFGSTQLAPNSVKKNGKSSYDRVISNGDSINVLCVFKIWNKCVETVQANTNIESYSLNADEFYEVFHLLFEFNKSRQQSFNVCCLLCCQLFNHANELDKTAFEDIVCQEVGSLL